MSTFLEYGYFLGACHQWFFLLIYFFSQWFPSWLWSLYCRGIVYAALSSCPGNTSRWIFHGHLWSKMEISVCLPQRNPFLPWVKTIIGSILLKQNCSHPCSSPHLLIYVEVVPKSSFTSYTSLCPLITFSTECNLKFYLMGLQIQPGSHLLDKVQNHDPSPEKIFPFLFLCHLFSFV